MPTLETGLLDNQDIVAYLEALGGHPSDLPTNRTVTVEFQAGIVALDDGLLDEGAKAPHAPTLFSADEDESPRATRRSAIDDTPHIGLFGAAAFLLGMTLLGASAAALVFHARVPQIFGG
ncbi:MAG: hypothetical protein Q7J25_06535 [Vicinamibacterales bacterium]|nr:hypothetical protein [Vicinamibacterales bacterium]